MLIQKRRCDIASVYKVPGLISNLPVQAVYFASNCFFFDQPTCGALECPA
jgi:hypothetical protein